ncbi:MAG: SMP-30/gluconolactonase/LRE family protein [Mangrovicoccus sp.]
MAEIFDSRVCELGEGPFWHPERQQFFWFDILNKRLYSRQGDVALHWEMDELTSAAGWIDRDRLLIATETGLYIYDLESWAKELVVQIEAGRPETRSNDGRADPWGGFWIGTMGKSAEPGLGAIYRYAAGELRALVTGITVPNSICFAPDRSCAYYADSRQRQILRQPLDPAGWPQGEASVFVDLVADARNPDGSVTDAEGGLWNAQWGSARVARYFPDGRFDRAFDLGGRHSSCPAFGGAGYERLFVTSALEALKDPQPGDGLTYEVVPHVKGLAEPQVQL